MLKQFIRCASVLCCGATLSAAPPKGVLPSRATIENHMDRDLTVYGKYAAVKLPITRGVKLWNPTLVETAPDGTIYAANYTGEIYTLQDSDGDGLEDTAQFFADVKNDKLRYPTGIAFKGKDVYIATTQEIRVYTDTNGDGVADESRTFFDDFPWTLHYYDWTFALTFGPDGHLYFILCTDYLNSNAAPDPHGYRGSILKLSPDGKDIERYAYGLRYPYGMVFNQHGDLFFSDNRGGGNPTEEFNHAIRGGFYGHNKAKYPHHGTTIDPLIKIEHGFGSGGLCANPPDNDFGGTAGQIFFACWGPDGKWDRGSIVRIELEKQKDNSYKATEMPMVKNLPKVIDLAFGKDGSMYAARFGKERGHHIPHATPRGDIYRFFYAPWLPSHSRPSESQAERVKGNVQRGKQLYSQLACAGCHSLDGTTELLGPNLKGIGDMFSRSEMVKAINDPSAGIKSGHETTKLTLKNGDSLVGRMVNTDESGITFMLPGNQTQHILQKDIEKTENLAGSMMPPGLLRHSYAWQQDTHSLALVQDSSQTDDLLAYLNVREDRASTNAPSLKKEVAKSDSSNTIIWKFNYGNDAIKPYFHPLSHPKSGKTLTAFRPSDHPWHRGLWFCWKKINGVNYWEENKETQQSEGITQIVDATAQASDDFSSEFKLTLHYFPKKTKAIVLKEQRTVRVSAPDAEGNYRIDWDLRFTAEDDAVLDVTPPPHRGGPSWGGYGGMSFRASRDWETVQVANSSVGLLADPSKTKSGQTATWHSITRDNGTDAETLTMFDHPENPNAPTPWYIYRGSFRFLNPSPLYNGPITLKKGDTMHLRYRVLIQKGSPDTSLLNEESKNMGRSQ